MKALTFHTNEQYNDNFTGEIIELNSLQDLKDFMSKCEHEIILHKEPLDDFEDKDIDLFLEIYDDWRE